MGRKKAYARTQIPFFKSLINLKVNDQFIVYVKHHLGKLYVFIKDESAIKVFKEIIEKCPNMYESKLQLAKLLIKNEGVKDEGECLLCSIIDAYSSGELPSMTIVLAAYEEIKNTKNERLIEQYFVEGFDKFSKALQIMALEKFDQPYRVLANVSRVYTYKYPELIRRLVKSIPFPSSTEINKKYAFAIAETYKEYGKSILWESDTIDNLNTAEIYFEQAEIFYNNTSKEGPYERIRHAENLNKLKKYSQAVELLRNDELFSDERNKAFREYRYAEALYGLGENYLEQALNHINNAVKANNVDTYIAAFQELKGDILFKIDSGDEEWKQCFEIAIERADTDKYKKKLVKKYNEFLELLI